MTLKQVSVIVSNFNGAKYLPKLLESLVAQNDVVLEIIIVDRNSTDNSRLILQEYPTVLVIQEPPESGLVTGYSVGAEIASHELLFFCNEDMWFENNCLNRLADAIDLSKRVASADPWQWTYDGAVWIHGGTRFFPGHFRSRTPYPFRRNEFTVELKTGDEVPFACAGAFMIHRDVYQDVGGWDRSFFLDMEDIDLFIRTWQKGWKCVSVPEAKVYHAVNASNSKTISSGKLSVSKRRYVSGRSSGLVIATKHFGLVSMSLSFLFFGEGFIRHVCLLRVQQTYWNILSLCEFVHRLPGALNYRRKHVALRQSIPGESFFREPAFQGK